LMKSFCFTLLFIAVLLDAMSIQHHVATDFTSNILIEKFGSTVNANDQASARSSTPKERYEILLNNVSGSPFESIYEYQIDGNKLRVNETHVFWPKHQKLYSKFYMNFPYEGQKIFGFSQQYFFLQPETAQNLVIAEANAKMSANDHLAIVKAEGNWKNHDASISNTDIGDINGEENPLTWVESMQLYFGVIHRTLWLKYFSGFVELLEQIYLKEQIPLLKDLAHTPESQTFGDKLREEMKTYSSDIDNEHYHDFSKSTMGCLHINTDGIPISKEGETEGWWLPLNQNLVAWRAVTFFEPLRKFALVLGVVALHVNNGNLELVFNGTQVSDMDIEGIDITNIRLSVGPPNNIKDTRPTPPEKPTSLIDNAYRYFINAQPPNKLTPWAPREKLCPKQLFDKKIQQLETACTESGGLRCLDALAKAYPCFSYFLRSSKKFSHGIDGMLEIIVLQHLMGEASWDVLKTFAGDDLPWDEEMEEALEKINLQHTDKS